MDLRKLVVANSILIFLVMICLAFIYQTHAWITDLVIFIGLTLFYYWTWDIFRLNLPIFTMLILGHVLHGTGLFGWYHVSPVGFQWDHITHFFGALPFALIFFRLLEPWMTAKFFTKKNLLLLMTVFLAATGVGAMVEIAEFIGYLSFGFGEGAFMFGPGDGVAGKTGTDLIDVLGGGWVNAGWDFIYNTLGILVGMGIMICARLSAKKPEKAYYFESIEGFSKKIE